ncbi:hypothetical protein L3V83_13230 [Thiotrichales bacterium 19X7-9]|nr:hypothetical protein [Thiotrichales bacterium 19X7-9]
MKIFIDIKFASDERLFAFYREQSQKMMRLSVHGMRMTYIKKLVEKYLKNY